MSNKIHIHLSNLENLPTLEEKLLYVTNEIGISPGSIEFKYSNINTVLASYLTIREAIVELLEEKKSAWVKTIEQAKEEYVKENYISYEKLSTMTLKEIAELID
jgi:hypothetical protein